MSFPFTHVSGTTMNFRVVVPGFSSADGWTLRYYLTPRFTTPVQAPLTFDAAANADGSFQVQRSPVQTGEWAAGAYGWHREVIKGDEVHALAGVDEQGEVNIRPHPSTLAQGHDSRSHARRMLDMIQAALESRSSATQREVLNYAIGTRSLSYDDADTREALVKLHQEYAWAVADEDAKARMAAGLPNPRNIGVRLY